MLKTTRGLGLILLASLTLSGCSLTLPDGPAKPTSSESGSPETSAPADDASEAPASTQAAEFDAEPATGEQISGTDYAYRVPEGWSSAQYPDPEQLDPDTFAVRGQADAGLVDNLNTLRSPAGRLTPEVIETKGLAEFDALEGAEVKVNPRVVVAGAETVHFTISIKNAQGDFVLEQFYPTSDSVTYVATFTFISGASQEERMQVAGATLRTWEWK